MSGVPLLQSTANRLKTRVDAMHGHGRSDHRRDHACVSILAGETHV